VHRFILVFEAQPPEPSWFMLAERIGCLLVDDDTLNEDLIQRIRRHGRPAHLGILAVGPLELFAVADGLAVETGRRAQSCGHRNTGGPSGYVRSPIDD